MERVQHLFSRNITAKIMSGAVVLLAGGLLTIGLMFFMVNRKSADAVAINEAGSLRMLIQRVAKVGAEMEAGVGSDAEIRTAVKTFEQRLTDLINGNVEKGIESAPPRVRGQLMRVRKQWQPFRGHALRLLSSPPGSRPFREARRYLDEHDAVLHEAANRAVALYQAESEGKIARMKSWLYVLLGLSFIVFGGVFGVTRRALTPIHTLAEAAHQVQQGQLNITAEVDTKDELGHLAESFNQMIRSVRRSQEVLREEKERAEEMSRLKSAFLANMSHEIRTPLSAIIGFSDVLKEEVQEVATGCAPETMKEARETLMGAAEYTTLIRESGQRLMDTLESILELSKLESDVVELKPARVDVCREVGSVVDRFRRRAADQEIELQMTGCDTPCWATLDVAAVRRILIHLLSNALKFTKPGGTVRAEVQTDSTQVRFEIEDSGIGIDEKFLPHLFEPFKQESTGMRRSYEGIGLGLAVVDRLTKLMNGQVEVESEKGIGTCFTVTLPRQVGAKTEKKSPEEVRFLQA